MTDNPTQAVPFKWPFAIYGLQIIDDSGCIVCECRTRERAEELVARLNAAAPSEGGDWVRVPREPTREMIIAGDEGSLLELAGDFTHEERNKVQHSERRMREYADAYRAMLAAASAPPVVGGDAPSTDEEFRYRFDRYVGGQLMAEGAIVRARNEYEALVKARALYSDDHNVQVTTFKLRTEANVLRYRPGLSESERNKLAKAAPPAPDADPRGGEQEALLPCPFCDGTKINTVTDDGRAWEVCGSCGAAGPANSRYDGEEGTPCVNWNTRAALRPQPNAGALTDSARAQAAAEEIVRTYHIGEVMSERKVLYNPSHAEKIAAIIAKHLGAGAGLTELIAAADEQLRLIQIDLVHGGASDAIARISRYRSEIRARLTPGEANHG